MHDSSVYDSSHATISPFVEEGVRGRGGSPLARPAYLGVRPRPAPDATIVEGCVLEREPEPEARLARLGEEECAVLMGRDLAADPGAV